MFKRIVIGGLMATVLATGALAGQNTGGDKGRRTRTRTTRGLSPQPLPPGSRRYRRHRRHPDAFTVKQK